jgi:hypothetical protein
MNDRIFELAKQAGLQPYYYAQEQHIQKFAELIVAECLKQADIIRDDCEADDEDQQSLGAEEVGLAIARHFGVVE